MLLSEHSSNHDQLKMELRTAGEQLFIALDRYAGICSTVRNAYHQVSFNNPQSARLLWSNAESELRFIPLLEARVREVAQNLNRVFEMGKAKSSPHPVHKLPDELLALIFRFAVAAQAQDSDSADKFITKIVPQYPDSIVQTCARWRQVALACPHLWTRVYLTAPPALFKPILNYAELYAKRAGHQSLELCIIDLQDDMDPDDRGLEQFIASVAPRTKSLEFVRTGLYPSIFERKSLCGILRGCSEAFTTLAIHSKGLYRPGLIKPLDSEAKNWHMEIDLSAEHIERGLAHLTVLHASQIVPMWRSAAYQGLVDLRLISNHKDTRQCPVIEASEFIAILQASPRLRILHFGLYLSSLPHHPPTDNTSVQLNSLEVLHLSASGTYGTENEIQRIMSLFSKISIIWW